MESCLRIKHFENSRGNRINSYGQNVCFINELLRHQADEVVDPGAELADFSIGEAALDGHGSHEFNQLTGEVGCEGTRLRGAVFTVRKQIFGPESGSILDEWRHLGTDLQLTLNEISYLKRCSIPHRKNETILAENKTLIIQELLQEHEVMFIQID